MKTKIKISIIILFINLFWNIFISQAQVFYAEWNSDTGIPYRQSFDLNTGFNAFKISEDGNISFHLKQDYKIRIFDMLSGKKINDLTTTSDINDFYNNDLQKSQFARTEKISGHSFSLNFKGLKKEYHTIYKLASAALAGYNDRNIYVDVQYIKNEIPLKVEREIWIITYGTDGISEEHIKVKIPDCYYIYVKNDIFINSKGAFYALTSPAGVEIFKIEEGVKIPLNELYQGYHYNFYLLKSQEGNDSNTGFQ